MMLLHYYDNTFCLIHFADERIIDRSSWTRFLSVRCRELISHRSQFYLSNTGERRSRFDPRLLSDGPVLDYSLRAANDQSEHSAIET